LALDEIGVASGREVGNVVYSIAGGVGKQRANRDGSAKVPNTWRIFILSTGEISITARSEKAGNGHAPAKRFGYWTSPPTPERTVGSSMKATIQSNWRGG